MDIPTLEKEAKRLFELWGLTAEGWTFALDNCKRTAGMCRYRPKLITISRYHAENDPEEWVMDTLLHEMAHALAGHAAGHGPVWKQWAIRLGAQPTRLLDTEACPPPPGKYVANCPTCGKTFYKYSRPRSVRYCGTCGVSPQGKLTYRENVTTSKQLSMFD